MNLPNQKQKTTACSLIVLSAMLLAACDGKSPFAANSGERIEVQSVRLTNVSSEPARVGERKTFEYEACITGENTANVDVEISDGFQSRSAKTNGDGCFTWQERHIVRAEKDVNPTFMTIQRTVTVSGAGGMPQNGSISMPGQGGAAPQPTGSSATYGRSTSIPMNFNPQATVPQEVLVEAGTVTPQTLTFDSQLQLAQRSGKELGRAWAPWIALQFLGHNKEKTQVNRLLTLKPAQRFTLRMDPRIMLVNENRDVRFEPVKFGEFEVSILLFTESNFEAGKFTADNLIAEYSGTLKTRFDGNVIEDILLRIHDLAGVLSRNMAIVTIEPVGETAKTVSAGFYYANISPLRANNAHLDLREITNPPEDLLARLDVARQRAAMSQTGPQMLQIAGYRQFKVPAWFLQARLNNQLMQKRDHDVMANICKQLMPSNLEVEHEALIPRWIGRKVKAQTECMTRWGRLVRAEVRDFVENVKGVQHLPQLQSTRYLNITRDLNHLMISRQEINQNMNLGVYGDFGIHKGKDLLPGGPHLAGGAKISAGMNLHMMRARNREKIFNAQIHEGQHFQVYIDGYNLDLELRRCLIIQPTMEGVRGAYACTTSTHRKKVPEKYFLVNHGRDSSPFTDNDSPETTNFRMIIRGEETYAAFEKMMTSENKIYELTGWLLSFEGADLKRPLLPDMRVTQEFPGSLKVRR